MVHQRVICCIAYRGSVQRNDPGFIGSNSQLDGTISPGKKMDGMVGFEAPKDWKTMEIHFKDDVWSNSKFKFEIEK